MMTEVSKSIKDTFMACLLGWRKTAKKGPAMGKGGGERREKFPLFFLHEKRKEREK